MGTLLEDLAAPGGQTHEVIETGLAWVFLGTEEVLKVKKPVSFGGFDCTTPERRRSACLAEVRRNGPLAPDVYRGVEPITFDERGDHRVGGSGEAVDWAVRMRRLPERDRADVRLAEGRLSEADLARVAAKLADFHESSRCDEETARFATADAIASALDEDLASARETLRRYLSRTDADELEALQRRFVAERGGLFEERIERGRVVDGHGDLRLGHLYLADEAAEDTAGTISILSRVELDPHLRYADVCADVAVLAADLAGRGRVDLAERFLAAYADAANDFELYPLVDFYASRHAFARGLLAAMLAADAAASPGAREKAAAETRRCFRLALAEHRRGLLPPVVLAMGGLVGSGKSSVARAIAREMGAPVVEVDHTRSSVLQGAPRRASHGARSSHEADWVKAFEPGFGEVVYGEVFERAHAVLASGRPVVIDGCFGTPDLRATARRLAQDSGAPFLFAECRVDEGHTRERLSARSLADGSGPDAWHAIAADFRRRFQPVTELPAEEHVVLDTARPLSDSVRALETRLPTWPEGPDVVSRRRMSELDSMRENLRVVTFDCWGTLLFERDMRIAHRERVRALARAASVSEDRARAALDDAWHRHMELWQEGVVTGAHEVARWTLAKLDAFEPEAAEHLVGKLQDASLETEILPLEGALETLERVAEAGLHRALVCDTGFSPGRVVRELLDRAGLLALLEAHVFSDEVGVPKPHRRMFETALVHFDAEASEAVHVGDLRRTDVAGAREFGMGTVRIAAHHDDKSELPEADAVAKSYVEVRQLLGLD